jgi:hypothetical protein
VQFDIRFVSKIKARTLVAKTRDCRDLAEALRWAAACLEKSTPEDQQLVTGVRIRQLDVVIDIPPAPALALTDG